MKIQQSITIILLFILPTVHGQGSGINTDPFQKGIGEIPYEMKGRIEERKPLISFDDATRWTITTKNCEARLYRTQEQRVFRNYSGKIIYKATGKKASFTVELKDPIELKNSWDCINFWNYGDHWMWEPDEKSAMVIYVLIRDGKGEIHKFRMVQQGSARMTYKYWFMNHMKLKNKLHGPAKFIGFEFKSNSADTGVKHTIFLESVYVYKEVLKPITFKEFPSKLPFPLRNQTILPFNKTKEYQNSVSKDGDQYLFTYAGKDAKIVYWVDPKTLLKGISVRYNNSQRKKIFNNAEIITDSKEKVNWKIQDQQLRNDTLLITYQAKNREIDQKFKSWYTIKQKSLIWQMEEEGEKGIVSQIILGSADAGKDARLVPIPFLNYNYKERPFLFYSDDLFYFTMFDWYYTNASSFFAGHSRIKNGQAKFNGGVRYIPLINGKRNLLREKLFINVSPDVQEVFPTIDNPSSPLRSVQADRFWAINGGNDLDTLAKFVTDMRSKGLDKVTIRYHEGFWRKGGESYTFKLMPNPDLGVQKIKDYVAWVQSQGWKVGLYSNYTDLAPVNSNFNEDWMKRGPKGEWEVSWARNYSPKPQIAWEQEALFAPKIHKMFNTDHSYCDVHTAISPMSRVDYDYRVPEAGKFRRVIELYGMLLMNERKSYHGPVYSEGNNHWWYAGLLDGNYANGNLEELPVFPDFQLLQLHPKEMDAGNTHDKDSYLAYTLAYGNIGILSEGLDAVRRYAMIQPLQEQYVMIPVTKIEYIDQGIAYNSSEAVKKNLIKAPKLHLEYSTGLQVYTNFSEEEWILTTKNSKYSLPRYGVLAYMPEGGVFSFSGRNKESVKGTLMDMMISDKLCYLNTHGEKVTNGPLKGQGSYMLKKEKIGWEIIPLGEPRLIDFERDLIHISGKKLKIQELDKNGIILNTFFVDQNVKNIRIFPKKNVYKYKISPE